MVVAIAESTVVSITASTVVSNAGSIHPAGGAAGSAEAAGPDVF
jgi:hypothetical protein